MTTKQIDIKNRTYSFLKDFSPSMLKLHKKDSAK